MVRLMYYRFTGNHKRGSPYKGATAWKNMRVIQSERFDDLIEILKI